jgi:hypothetical protein
MKITSLKNGGFKAEPTIPSTLVDSKGILSLLIDSRLNGNMNEKDIINSAANDAIMNDGVVLIDVSQLKSYMDAQAIIRSDNSKAQMKVFKEYKVNYLKDITILPTVTATPIERRILKTKLTNPAPVPETFMESMFRTLSGRF